MCKSHKIASQGDAVRIPYSALKQYPVRRATRVNRHDAGLWGDDGYPDPVWPPDVEFQVRTRKSRRKSTRRWCKGKPGREHVRSFVLSPFWRAPCRPSADVERWRRGKTEGPWYCSHREVCATCGKILREPWQIGTDCPLYPAGLRAQAA